MVLSPTDAPQLGTLPDLAHVLRRMLLQTELDQCGFVLAPLYAALPCIRRQAVRKAAAGPPPQKNSTPQNAKTTKAATKTSKDSNFSKDSKPPPTEDTHQVAICVLLGLLLGLYPTSIKFPPFPVRVALYRRVHALLTSGGGLDFCQAHPALLAMAMMEYCAYVIPAYLPVEHDLLLTAVGGGSAGGERGESAGMQAFFAAAPLACDAFRQEALLTGEEPWGALESHCAPIVERHARACKSRQKKPTAHHHSYNYSYSAGEHNTNNNNTLFPAVKLPAAAVDCLAEIPFVVPYPIHLDDPTHRIMASEMAFLGIPNITPIISPSEKKIEIKHEHAAALQRTIHAHQLPPNLTRLQLGALSDRMRICERSALSCNVLYVCVSCVMANQQTICRQVNITE
jgi:hypothetical protein